MLRVRPARRSRQRARLLLGFHRPRVRHCRGKRRGTGPPDRERPAARLDMNRPSAFGRLPERKRPPESGRRPKAQERGSRALPSPFPETAHALRPPHARPARPADPGAPRDRIPDRPRGRGASRPGSTMVTGKPSRPPSASAKAPSPSCEIGNGDIIYVDDEGLLKPLDWFFAVKGGHQPFAGCGLVLGSNAEGETVSARIALHGAQAPRPASAHRRQESDPVPRMGCRRSDARGNRDDAR